MSTQFICLSALALKYGTLEYWKRVVERSIRNEWRGAKRPRGTLGIGSLSALAYWLIILKQESGLCTGQDKSISPDRMHKFKPVGS